MKLKPMTNFVLGVGVTISALTSACTIAAQPTESLIPALYKAFTEHPTHCAALLDGRAGDLVTPKTKNLQRDDLAAADLKALQSAAVSSQQRAGIDRSLLRDCGNKQTM